MATPSSINENFPTLNQLELLSDIQRDDFYFNFQFRNSNASLIRHLRFNTIRHLRQIASATLFPGATARAYLTSLERSRLVRLLVTFIKEENNLVIEIDLLRECLAIC